MDWSQYHPRQRMGSGGLFVVHRFVIIPSADADGTDFGIEAVWMMIFSFGLVLIGLICVLILAVARRQVRTWIGVSMGLESVPSASADGIRRLPGHPSFRDCPIC